MRRRASTRIPSGPTATPQRSSLGDRGAAADGDEQAIARQQFAAVEHERNGPAALVRARHLGVRDEADALSAKRVNDERTRS